MTPDDRPHVARIGLLARPPWAAAGLAAELGPGPASAPWELRAMAQPQPADAYLLHEPDAVLWAALPARLPAVALGGEAPRDEGSRPLGLLAAGADVPRIRAALAAVLAGLSVQDPARERLRTTLPDGADAEPLTERELQVLELMAKGLTNRDIGGVLGISAHTAKFHVAQVLAKLGVASRAEAVGVALRLGLIGL